MAKYSMLRLFLGKREITPLLKEMGVTATEKSRFEYLSELFKQNVSFTHSKAPFSYAYIGDMDNFILGRIGRLRSEVINEGPETGFAEKVEKFWHASNFLIDITEHEDGQKIAFEDISDVGAPFGITKSLIQHINNTNSDSQWQIYANPITESSEFWAVVNEYRGSITELELTFTAPNMFGGRDKTEERLRKWKNDNNMATASIKLNNGQGAIEPDTEEVRESLEYISQGGGGSKMKSGRKVIYDSDTKALSESVEDELDYVVSEETKPRWKRLIDKLFLRK